MSHQFCSFCGFVTSEPICPSCHKPQSQVDMAVATMAKEATHMLTAFRHAQALPLIDLLERWWNALSEERRSAFSDALAQRVMGIAARGEIDDLLRPLVRESFSKEVVGARIDAMQEAHDVALDEAIRDAMRRHVAEIWRDERYKFASPLRDGMEKAVREIAREVTANQRETIEGLVRDQLPALDEMTKKALDEVSEELTSRLARAMRKDRG